MHHQQCHICGWWAMQSVRGFVGVAFGRTSFIIPEFVADIIFDKVLQREMGGVFMGQRITAPFGVIFLLASL
ncbi:hypothetical protein [Escherichia coli]|uniref:hypothetical protein n=1 Tax=Escherichia coli TaxID=562 RepID=UPI0015C43F67|nr:hypothetical protein [Escherichia coli]